jgi:hypothetical protein
MYFSALDDIVDPLPNIPKFTILPDVEFSLFFAVTSLRRASHQFAIKSVFCRILSSISPANCDMSFQLSISDSRSIIRFPAVRVKFPHGVNIFKSPLRAYAVLYMVFCSTRKIFSGVAWTENIFN